jgi:hypothetical protein
MNRQRALWISGVATAVLFLVLAIVDGLIENSGGPGIVAFEVAGTTDRATEILGHWGQDGRAAARVSLGLDFVYLAVYATFLVLAVLALRDSARARGWDRYARPAVAVAVLPVVAALCDVAENAGLVLMVEGTGVGRLPPVVLAFALVKFAALAVTLLYLLGGLAAIGLERLREQRDQPEPG